MTKKKPKEQQSIEPKKVGAPVVEIDMVKLGAFCRMKPTAVDCAAFFDCSVDTIERRIKEATGLTFSEFRSKHLVKTKYSLIQSAIQKAQAGDNQMIQYCLNNLSDWSNKNSGDVNVNVQNNVAVCQIDIEERIAQLKGK